MLPTPLTCLEVLLNFLFILNNLVFLNYGLLASLIPSLNYVPYPYFGLMVDNVDSQIKSVRHSFQI